MRNHGYLHLLQRPAVHLFPRGPPSRRPAAAVGARAAGAGAQHDTQGRSRCFSAGRRRGPAGACGPKGWLAAEGCCTCCTHTYAACSAAPVLHCVRCAGHAGMRGESAPVRGAAARRRGAPHICMHAMCDAVLAVAAATCAGKQDAPTQEEGGGWGGICIPVHVPTSTYQSHPAPGATHRDTGMPEGGARPTLPAARAAACQCHKPRQRPAGCSAEGVRQQWLYMQPPAMAQAICRCNTCNYMQRHRPFATGCMYMAATLWLVPGVRPGQPVGLHAFIICNEKEAICIVRQRHAIARLTGDWSAPPAPPRPPRPATTSGRMMMRRSAAARVGAPSSVG